MKPRIKSHEELEVYQLAFRAAMQIFEMTKGFPTEERYSLTDQIRRSSRSVCANCGEAFRKRRYEAAFVSKLSDSEAEAAETQIWLDFSLKCRYIDDRLHHDLKQQYDFIIGKLVRMMSNPKVWLLPRK